MATIRFKNKDSVPMKKNYVPRSIKIQRYLIASFLLNVSLIGYILYGVKS